MALTGPALWLFPISLLLPLDVSLAASDYDHLLVINFTITVNRRNGGWYKDQVHMDGKDVTDSPSVTELKVDVKEMADETRRELLHNVKELPQHHRTSEPFSLQGRLEYHMNANDTSSRGYLTLGFDGKIALIRHLKARHWTVVDPVGAELEKILSREKYLDMKYMALLMEHSKILPTLVNTRALPTIVLYQEVTAKTTTPGGTVFSKATTFKLMPWPFIVLLGIFLYCVI